MIEDGENVERNSSEDIESPGVYIYIYIRWTHVLLKLYIFINFSISFKHYFFNLIIYWIFKIILYI